MSFKNLLRGVLTLVMVGVGANHFASPESYTRIVPPYLPYPLALVYISGFFEILGGVGILIPRLRYPAALGLVALYICVFPANIHMALHQISFGSGPTPAWILWARLPAQLVFIAWAYWMRKK